MYDDTTFGIEMTLWGEHADHSYKADQIVIFKDVKVGEYKNTKNLSWIFNSKAITDMNVLYPLESYKI